MSADRADLLGRSLPVPPGADPAAVLRDYLSAARTKSAQELAKKAVILITPEHAVGDVVWRPRRHAISTS